MNRWRWVFLLPPFILGVCLAVAGQVAVGLLLYGGAGFLEALSVILATLAGALGFGIWTGRGMHPGASVEGVRRRWLFTLVAFTAAVVFSGAWEYFGAFGVRPWSQAMGLALLAGLPLFFGGSLVGAMVRSRSPLQPPRWANGRPTPGVATILGAGVGFLATGFVLFPRLSAPHLLLVCVVLLSAGALVHGWILDQVTLVREVEWRRSERGDLRVEHWVRGRPRRLLRALLENGRLRGLEGEKGTPALPGELAVQALLRLIDPPRTAIAIGGGAYTLPRLIRNASPDCRIVVLESDPDVTELAFSHFSVTPGARIEVRHGPPGEGMLDDVEGADLLVVSGPALETRAPAPVALRELLPWLDSLLGPGGIAFAHGFAMPARGPWEEPVEDPPLRALLDEGARRFPFLRLYRNGGEGLLVFGFAAPELPNDIDGFRLLRRPAAGSEEDRMEAAPGGV